MLRLAGIAALMAVVLFTTESFAVEPCAQCLANVAEICSQKGAELSGEGCFEKRAGKCYENDRCDVQADSDAISYRCAEQKLCRERNTRQVMEIKARSSSCGDSAACRDQADREERDAAEEYAACFDQSIGSTLCREPLSF